MKSTVLVVDDDEAVREVASEMLKTLDCDVTSVTSGPEALAALEQNSYDIVFLDVGMPIMSGVEVCRRVRKTMPAQKIAFITGFAEEDLTDFLDQNTWIVSKPFTIGALALASALERGRG